MIKYHFATDTILKAVGWWGGVSGGDEGEGERAWFCAYCPGNPACPNDHYAVGIIVDIVEILGWTVV